MNWTYYRYDTMSGVPPVFYRYGGGFADRLDQGTMAWVPTDADRLSRYIENGETMLDRISLSTLRAAIGQPVPD